MTKILFRAGKTPFTALSSMETFDSNAIGNNNGNLLFSSATHKLLSSKGVEVVAHGFNFSAAQAPRVNDEFDKFVLPLANAFRIGFEPQLRKITEFIEKLNIPTVMLSGGAQSGSDGTFNNLKPMESTVRDFCRAVLRTSSHITVRGERTAEYIRSLGFNDVKVIGCPSLTLNGPGHKVTRTVPANVRNISYNIESSKDIIGELVTEVENRYCATYFPQDMGTFKMMLWGHNPFKPSRDKRLPLHMGHSQFINNSAEFHLDPHTWIQRLKGFDFNFGPRIHGNVMAILAGTPSVVIAHDSRTHELSEFHEIPHTTPDKLTTLRSPEQLFERADYSNFNANHTKRFDNLIAFLHENGLKTIYDKGNETVLSEYESRLEGIHLPDPQLTEWASMSPTQLDRLKKIYSLQISNNRLVQENKKLVSSLRKAQQALKSL